MVGDEKLETYTGIILSMDKHFVEVATPQNAYYRVNRKSTMYIGKEIEFTSKDIVGYGHLIKVLSVAAACICLIAGVAITLIMNSNSALQEFAYVSLDINPGIKFTINENQKVLKADSLNDDAEKLIEDVNFKGMNLNDAVTNAIGWCEKSGIIDAREKMYLLISGALNTGNHKYKKGKSGTDDINVVLDELKENIEKTSGENHEIIVLKTYNEVMKEANKRHMSFGRYALYTELKSLGKDISIEEIDNADVKDLVMLYKDTKGNISTVAKVSSSPQPTVEITYTPTPSVLALSPTQSIVVNQTPIPTIKLTKPSIKATTAKSSIRTHNDGVKPGTGLRGDYFDNIDLSNFKLTRIDETIDFYWGINAPAHEIRDDESYSVRWFGKIRAAYSEEYTFYVKRDNGVRLWIDNKLIIDKWDNKYDVTDMGTIALEAGKMYDIKLEYFNGGGNGFVKFEWSSKSTKRSVVPKEYLYPGEKVVLKDGIAGDGKGLSFEYFDNDNFTDSKLKGIDPTVNFHWGYGSPDKAIKADQKFSIRWTGYLKAPYSEDYKFYFAHDDGVKVWIDDKLVLDKWVGSEGKMTETKALPLEAGKKYKIVIEYHNSGLYGQAKLFWESQSINWSIVPQTCLYPR